MIKTQNIKNIEELIKDKTAFIFDFDGTIANTEILQWEAYNVVLKKYNIVIKEEYLGYIGHTEKEIYKMIKRDFHIEFDEDKLLEERLQVYLQLVKQKELKPFDVFNSLLEKYKDIKFHILTSNREEVINEMLEYWNLKYRFDKIVSISNGKITKKDVLANTEQHFKENYNNVVLFEDMDRNLKLAVDENIVAIGIEHRFNYGLLKNCDAIIVGEVCNNPA